jgi:hypothetical protein
MTSLVPLEIGTEGNISGAHNVPRKWRAMVHKNVEHHKRIEISKNRRKKRHCTGNCLCANDAKKGSLASYMNTLPHHQTQKRTLDFVWINVLSCSSIAKQQQQQQKQQNTSRQASWHVTCSAAQNALAAQEISDHWSRLLQPGFYHAPRDFFNIFALNLLLKPFSPPQDTLPCQNCQSEYSCGCMLTHDWFFHCCHLKLPFGGRLRLKVWTMAHSWTMAQWNLKLSLTHNAVRGP